MPAGLEAAFRQEKLVCQVCTSPLSLLLQVTLRRITSHMAGAMPFAFCPAG